jgi:hypothetical protein
MAAVLAAIVTSAQWHFELDTTFRTEILRTGVSSVLPMNEAQVIASGVMRFPEELSDRRLVLLNDNGTRDLGFPNSGGGGKITPYQNNLYVGNGGIVRRILLPSGTNDQTFRLGYLPVPYFSSVQGGDYHVYPDGSILLSGAHMLSDTIRGFTGLHNLIWFTNTGYLDTTKTHRTGNGVVYRFKELPDGKFICSGLLSTFNGVPVDRLFRVHADGSTDTTFHTGMYWGEIDAYLPLVDGRVIVGGFFRTTQIPGDTLRLARLLPNGDLDPTFNMPQIGLGGLHNPSGLGPLVRSITPWEGGRMVVTGYFGEVNGQPRGSICMLDSTGQLLDAFDDCGVGSFVYQNIHYAYVQGFVPAGDGEHFYIHGAYVGYDDSNVNDTLQRFVSRLRLVEELPVAVQEEEEVRTGFRLWPNPANGNITFGHPTVTRSFDGITIRDLAGRIMTTLVNPGTTAVFTWDTTGLAQGIYLVEFKQLGKVVGTEKLVIHR